MFRFKVVEGSVYITDMEARHGPDEEFTLADSLARGSMGIASLIGAGKIRVVHSDADDPLVIEDRYVTTGFEAHRHVAVQSVYELAKEKRLKELGRAEGIAPYDGSFDDVPDSSVTSNSEQDNSAEPRRKSRK
ncbi:MAG: hypothetical protein M1343_08430 [Chloroflexi bacterium]|nr:hypothetical protein [Chloroflexota bacterium]